MKLLQRPPNRCSCLKMVPLHVIRGKVMAGSKRGRVLGFPTANIRLHTDVPDGVYASLVAVGGKQYRAAAFIGSAKTFGETGRKAEVFIIDFDQDIYSKWITISLLRLIRPNMKFAKVEELVTQIKKDVRLIRDLL
jgi:riboflavin kinase / FMN adenylyltransferase